MELPKLKIKKTHEDAILPTKAHDTDLGYDLYALEDYDVGDSSPTLIRTGISAEFPKDWGARIADRSSMFVKRNFSVGAGVIDSDYRGEIRVALISNHGTQKIEKGEKIAQFIPTKVINWEIVEVDDLSETARGTRGFGSSGR